MRNPTARLPASNKHSFHCIISSHSPGLLLPGPQLVLLHDSVAWGACLVQQICWLLCCSSAQRHRLLLQLGSGWGRGRTSLALSDRSPDFPWPAVLCYDSNLCNLNLKCFHLPPLPPNLDENRRRNRRTASAAPGTKCFEVLKSVSVTLDQLPGPVLPPLFVHLKDYSFLNSWNGFWQTSPLKIVLKDTALPLFAQSKYSGEDFPPLSFIWGSIIKYLR